MSFFHALLVACLVLLGACAAQPRDRTDASEEVLRVKIERANDALREARLIDAEVLYRQLSVSHPGLPEVWLQLGNIYTRQAQLQAASRAYRDGLKYAREDGRLWHNLALVELKQAMQTLETASEVLPQDSPYREDIGRFHQNLLSATSSATDKGRQNAVTYAH